MPRGRVDLEQVRQVARTSRSDSTKTKRRICLFDSSIDWKPGERTKMRGDVVCPWSFQDETGCIVLNSVYKAARKEGIAII